MRPGLEVDLTGRIGPLVVQARFESRAGPITLVGPNGAGKTSLLLMILGVLRPESGRIAAAGVLFFDRTAGLELRVEERRLGYVPQDYALFPHLNVLHNVAFGMRRTGWGKHSARLERARALLSDFGLGELSESYPGRLSGGEQQRVALVRALASEPRALLLDEPLSALDAGARREVRAFLAAHLKRLEIPAVVVTHDRDDARAVGEHIVVLEAGRIVQVGSLGELRAQPATTFVEQFATDP